MSEEIELTLSQTTASLSACIQSSHDERTPEKDDLSEADYSRMIPIGYRVDRHAPSKAQNTAVVGTKQHLLLRHEQDFSKKFDLMQVEIVLYGLSGVVERQKVTKKRILRHGRPPKSERMKSRKQKSLRFERRSVSSDNSSILVQQQLKHSEASSDYDNEAPPIRALVSFMRHAFSSSTSMESYVPSLPLQKQSSHASGATRYSASWSSGPNAEYLLGSEQCFFSTISILRTMEKQEYDPATRIGQISTYVHETMDLCVFVNRGDEIVPLGVASLILTGDEDDEIILNLPIRVPKTGSSIFDKHFQKKKSNKTNKRDFFSDSPTRAFSLDDNATLRVGLRVLPQEDIQKASESMKTCGALEEVSLEQLLDDMFQENISFEVGDDVSLIKKLQTNYDYSHRNENHMGFLQSKAFCGDSRWSRKGQPGAANDKAERVVLLPLSLVSSVSDTVTTIDVEKQYML